MRFALLCSAVLIAFAFSHGVGGVRTETTKGVLFGNGHLHTGDSLLLDLEENNSEVESCYSELERKGYQEKLVLGALIDSVCDLDGILQAVYLGHCMSISCEDHSDANRNLHVYSTKNQETCKSLGKQKTSKLLCHPEATDSYLCVMPQAVQNRIRAVTDRYGMPLKVANGVFRMLLCMGISEERKHFSAGRLASEMKAHKKGTKAQGYKQGDLEAIKAAKAKLKADQDKLKAEGQASPGKSGSQAPAIVPGSSKVPTGSGVGKAAKAQLKADQDKLKAKGQASPGNPGSQAPGSSKGPTGSGVGSGAAAITLYAGIYSRGYDPCNLIHNSPDTIFVFNDNLNQFNLKGKNSPSWCTAGGGNACLRPYNEGCQAHIDGTTGVAFGIPTGVFSDPQGGSDEKGAMAEALRRLQALLATGKYSQVMYNGGDGSDLKTVGNGIFDVDDLVKDDFINVLLTATGLKREDIKILTKKY